MSRPILRRPLLTVATALLLCPGAGWAQEGLGLDLTGETEAAPDTSPGQLGLDLSESAMELRPTLAIAPFVLEEGALESDLDLAAWFHARLAEGATRSNAFTRVIGPDEVRETLGASLEGLTACAAATCLEEAAQTLEVERLITGRIRRDEQGPLLVVRSAELRARLRVPRFGEGGGGLRGRSEQRRAEWYRLRGSGLRSSGLWNRL